MLAWALALQSVGEGNSSLSELDFEDTSVMDGFSKGSLPSRQVPWEVANVDNAVAALTESLAVANSEADYFKREVRALSLRMEALGVGGGESALEQRLLNSVADLRVLSEEKAKLASRLISLSEAVLWYVQESVSEHPEARLALEAELRETEMVLKGNAQTVKEGELTGDGGKVVSVKPELALAVLNIGSQHGVRLGMPFAVLRGDQRVGMVRVVEVREQLAGAILQNFNADAEMVKAGDRVRVETQ